MSNTKHILCLSTSSFEQCKIYTTDKQPEEELAEVNERGDVPEPYVMIDCLMDCSREKVERVFAVLSEYQYKGVFYRPWENLKDLFALLREQDPVPAQAQAEEEEAPAQESSDGLSEEEHIPKRKQTRKHWEYLGPYHGKPVRHEIGTPGTPEYSVKYGHCDTFRHKGIVGDDGIEYSFSSFGGQHYRENNRRASGACCGTTECQIEVSDGVWLTPNEIPTNII